MLVKGEFSAAIKRVLAKRASERCTICNVSTLKPNLSNPAAYINVGEAANIRGAQYAKHNRYDDSINGEQRSSIENAIWLCRTCHKKIDSDS